MIPAIIIQTWRSAALPDGATVFCDSWRRLNPSFEYRFYDDEACLRLVEATVPAMLDAYRAFPHPVMRADFFRYAALYHHGGVYADIDMECVRPVAPLLGLAAAVLGIEAHLTRRRQRELGYARPLQIANSIIFSGPGHPFFMEAMRQCVHEAARRGAVDEDEIEDVTGPRMLTRLFYAKPRGDVAVLRQTVLAPPRHYPVCWPFDANVHARHHFFGSWKSTRQKPIARRWIERDLWPNPFGRNLLEPALNGGSENEAARAA